MEQFQLLSRANSPQSYNKAFHCFTQLLWCNAWIKSRPWCKRTKPLESSKHTGRFVPIDFCLLNTRSINDKALSIKDYDILAMTETWLGENEYCSVGEICPTGYSFYHIPISRGGGVGLLMKKRIQVKKKKNLYSSSSRSSTSILLPNALVDVRG